MWVKRIRLSSMGFVGGCDRFFVFAPAGGNGCLEEGVFFVLFCTCFVCRM